MPTVLDNFIVLFGESGAKKLEKTIDNIGKAVVNSVNKSIAAHKTLERHRNNSLKNLTNANKLRHKLAQEASKIEERTLRKTVPLEKQLVDALKRRERLEKAISELSKNTVDYQRKRVELAKINEKIVGIQTKLNTINAKKEKEAAKEAEKRQKALEKEQEKKEQAEARARKKAARDKLNDFKAWRNENGLAAKEKRLEAGREWVETKRINKKKGEERGKRIAIQRKAKEAREEERKRLADEKERTRLEKASLDARASNIRKIASFFGLSRGAMLGGAWGAAIMGAGMLAKGTWDFASEGTHRKRKRYGSYLGTGTTPEFAVGLDKELYSYGAEKGEAMQLLSQLSAGIGAMRYGDTSLVQTLGTFGIGGIGAHSKSKDVLRSIWQRAQGMDEEEREAMFNALGFSRGIKTFMRKGKISDIELEKITQEWTEKDTQTLKNMYEVENSIAIFVEKIAGNVGQIVNWLTNIPLIPIVASQSGDTTTITNNNSNIINNNYGGLFADNNNSSTMNLDERFLI